MAAAHAYFRSSQTNYVIAYGRMVSHYFQSVNYDPDGLSYTHVSQSNRHVPPINFDWVTFILNFHSMCTEIHTDHFLRWNDTTKKNLTRKKIDLFNTTRVRITNGTINKNRKITFSATTVYHEMISGVFIFQ